MHLATGRHQALPDRGLNRKIDAWHGQHDPVYFFLFDNTRDVFGGINPQSCNRKALKAAVVVNEGHSL